MAVKSIIEVDVQDEAFKRFQALFDKYNTQLAKAPAWWAAATKEQQQQVKGFQAVAAALLAQGELMRRQSRELETSRRETERSESAWRKIAAHAKSTSESIATATRSVLKWGGIGTAVTGALAVGSLFGLDRLAESVAGLRRGAAGLGVTPGEARAFGLNFGRFVEPSQVLGGVSGALRDVTSRSYVGLLAAGLDPKTLAGKDAAEVSVELLRRLPSLFGGTPQALLGSRLKALNLDELFSVQDVTRYLQATPEERRSQERRYRGDVERLALDPSTTRAWQDFATQMSRAGDRIENTFVRALVGLAGPLDKLSGSVERTIETFLGSEKLKTFVNEFGEGIEKAAKYVGSDQFQNDVRNFVDGIGVLAGAVMRVARLIAPGQVATTAPAPSAAGGGFGSVSSKSVLGRLLGLNSPAATPGQPLNEDQLLAMVRGLERSGDQAVSPAGAIGRYQIMPGTARQYGYDPGRLTDPAYNEQAARAVLRDLVRRYHGNVDEVLAAYNAGPGRANRFRDAGDNAATLPGETQGYLSRAHAMTGYNAKVEITNNTGGNAVVSASQIPQ